MADESVVWTVLPNGIDDDGRLKATIFVSPRLVAGGGSRPLSSYDSFANWPKALAELKFVVEVEGVGGSDAQRDPRVAEADPQAWALVFGGDVGVIDREFKDLSTRVVRSFPADEVARNVLGLYHDIAVDHPSSFPPVTTGPLADLAGDIGNIGNAREKEYKRLDAMLDAEASQIAEGRRGRYLPRSAIPAGQRRRMAFLQTYRFYDRFRNGVSARPPEGPIDPAAVPPPPKPPAFDFHTYVAALGDYPFLLRTLGLAIDVVIDPDPAYAGDHRLRLHVEGNPQPWMTTEAARPWLNYEWEDRFFLPRPRSKERDIRDGQLNLPSDFFAVHQIDIDGSAMKTLNVAASALNVANKLAVTQPSMTPDELALPALRSTGFTIVKNDRAEAVVASFDHAVGHDANEKADAPANLFAEDVIRGYRLDVEAKTSGRFLSLCERVGDYVMHTPAGEVPIAVPPDEGYVKGSSTTSVPDDEELYLHEAVASWAGWSLVAHRPGQTVNREEELAEEPQEIDPGVPLVTSFHATPGSLPRMRYGIPYRFRARVVDLAGNSVDTRIIGDEYASFPQPFFRWEPVPSPAVIPRRPYSEGESQLRMVIRSTLDVDTAGYVALPRIENLNGHTAAETAYQVANERWLAAPKTSQQMAEYHGVFDAAIGKGAAPAAVDAAFDLASREAGVLPEEVPGDTLALPYLPDVSGRGVALTTLPHDPQGATRRIIWPADDPTLPWWDRQPLRIRIVEGTAPAPVTPTGALTQAVWDEAERVLTVFLPQSELVTLRLASAVTPDDLAIQGVWDMVKGSLTPQQRAAAANSGMWMVTPWSNLTLVHAVEKPLLPPVVDVPPSGLQRQRGETFCALVGTIDNHAKSTGRLDVEATWTEQVDDLAQDAPDDGDDGRPLRHGHGHVGDFSLQPNEDDCLVGRDDQRPQPGKPAVHKLRHEFGDTKHRLVNYRATATTRFREYFPPEIIEGVGADGVRLIEHPGASVARHVPSSRRPDPPEIEYVLPTFTWTQTTHMSGALGGPGGGLAGRRPAVTTRRTRSGGGLRVYLKRGWYSSGDGELLGVVLTDQPWLTWPIDLAAGLEVSDAVRVAADQVATRLFERAVIRPGGRTGLAATERLVRAAGLSAADLAAAAEPATRFKAAEAFRAIDLELAPIIAELFAGGIDPDKLVTHWGRDPIWGSALPAAGPFIHQFPLRTAVGTGLSLAETAKAKVTVVGHKPRYDPERQLWYCDIQVEAGSAYTPFVRLALCRYQPHSIEDTHLSRVVLADFAQLVPPRVASFTPRLGSVSVSVRGPAGYTQSATRLTGAPEGEFGQTVSRRVSAQVQQLAEGADPDLAWADVGTEVDLPASVGTAGLSSVNWSASVPVAEAPAGFSRRLLVREYERIETDPDAEDPLEATRVIHAGPVEFPSIVHVRERVVYADTFEF